METLGCDNPLVLSGGSEVKCLPAMLETWVRSLRREDTLEKEMATDYNVLAWRIPWTEEPGNPSSWGRKELDRLCD